MSETLVISSSRRCFIELCSDKGEWTVRRYEMELGVRKCVSTHTFSKRQPAYDFAENMKREHDHYLTANS